MSAATLKLVIEKGTTFKPRFTYKNEDGSIVDLTNYTARMQVRAEIDSTTPILDLTTENSGIVLGGQAGTIDLFVSDTVTSAIIEEEGVYDLEIESAAGVVTRVLEGKVTFKPEVTR